MAAPFNITANTKVGIGIDPTETLDVNGAIRLRTLPLQSQSNVSAGSILFDGSNLKDGMGLNGMYLLKQPVMDQQVTGKPMDQT